MKNFHALRALLVGALLYTALCGSLALVGCGGGGGSVAAPTITAQSSSQSAVVGSAVTLSVTASGDGATYQWYRGTATISGATGASLTISPAATTDSGSYYVVVTNSVGSDTSATIALTVTASTGSGTVTVN